jgi:hypothetical protein
MHFCVGTKKTTTFLLFLCVFFVNFARKVSLEIFDQNEWPHLIATIYIQLKCCHPLFAPGRFAPLNRYYIILDGLFRQFFGNYLFISCMQKKIIHSFSMVYFDYLFISCIQKNNNSFILVSGIFVWHLIKCVKFRCSLSLFDTWYEIWYLLLLNIREISIWRRVWCLR